MAKQSWQAWVEVASAWAQSKSSKALVWNGAIAVAANRLDMNGVHCHAPYPTNGRLKLNPMNQSAIIIGAGPAGLYCANTLGRRGFKGSVLVLERGPKFLDRFLSHETWDFDPNNVLTGEGGAGFLADAKLCLSSTAGAQFSKDLGGEYPRALLDLDVHIWQKLLDLGHEIRRSEPNPTQKRMVLKRLEKLGLECDTYPVRPLGSDMAAEFLKAFTAETSKFGAEFRYRSDVRRIVAKGDGTGFRLTVKDNAGDQELECTHLFVAVGWAGSSDLHKFALGMMFDPNDLDIGVRVEFPEWAGSQLREIGQNPKIKLYDGLSYAKTHCLVHRGRAFHYFLNEHCLVDAHAVHHQPSNASSINFLYRVSVKQWRDPLQIFRAISSMAAELGNGRPLSQPLGEFLKINTLPSANVGFEPTLAPPKSVHCDLGLLLPDRAINTIRNLIMELGKYAPGLLTRESMVYAPAAQWLMPKVRLDPNFALPGLRNAWCIGDGTGLTAGVLPAAVSGVIAARDAISKMEGTSFQNDLWSFP